MHANSAHRRRLGSRTAQSFESFETLEPRTMLNSDLGVRFKPNQDLPSRFNPGDRALIVAEVINSGPETADGQVTLEFFLSNDQTLQTSTDRLLRRYSNQDLFLPVFNNNPDNIGEFTADLTIPTNTPAGRYFFLVRVLTRSGIFDFTLGNNTASTTSDYSIGRNSDLSVRFASNQSLATTYVPGERFVSKIEVLNNGPLTADGKVTIEFYFSTDNTLSTSTDRRLRVYSSQQLFLEPFGNNPNNFGTFDADLPVPTALLPGRYFLIARILPDADIADPNAANNVAVTTSDVRVAREFGTVDGRANVVLTLVETDGTRVNFSLSGPGTGAVQAGSSFGITLSGTTTASTFRIDPTAGVDQRVLLSSLTLSSPIGSVIAPAAQIFGPLTFGPSISELTLGDAFDGLIISIPSTSVPTRIRLGNVRNVRIDAPAGLAFLGATAWNDTDATPDLITAPFLDRLDVLGNLSVSMRLTGRAFPAVTLGPVTVGGVLKGGSWGVNGLGTTISALASTVDFAASFDRRLDSLTTSGTFRGLLTARSIGRITSGKDILAAFINAGPFLGLDARYGGTGDDADIIRSGNIGDVSIAFNLANTTIAAGLDRGGPTNIRQALLGGTVSRINSVTVGNFAGITTFVLANRIPGGFRDSRGFFNLTSDPRTTLITNAPTPTISNIAVTSSLVTFMVRFASTNLMRSLGVGQSVLITRPNLTTTLAVLRTFAFENNEADLVASFEFGPTGPMPFGPGDVGTYQVSIVADTIRDARGNAVPAQTIGTFTI